MSVYWVSFRIANEAVGGRTYEDRYQAFIVKIASFVSGTFWEDTTSFIVFESNKAIGDIALGLRQAIAVSEDMFLIRVMDQQAAIISGSVKSGNIFMLMPYLKKV